MVEIETLLGSAGVSGACLILLVMWLTQSFSKRIDRLIESDENMKDALIGPDGSLKSEITEMHIGIVKALAELKIEFVNYNDKKKR